MASKKGPALDSTVQRKADHRHHPLMAFMAEMRMVVNSWLRPGDTHDVINYQFINEDMLHETFKRPNKRGSIGVDGQTWRSYDEQRKDRIPNLLSGFKSGSISPLLSNIYLHHVLDEWFITQIKPRLKGNASYGLPSPGKDQANRYWRQKREEARHV